MTRTVVVVVAAVVAAVVVAGLSACGINPANLPPMTFDVAANQTWPETAYAPAPEPGEGRIYITDNLDDTISIVDLDSAEAGAPEVLAKVPVGFVPVEREGPHHVTVDQKGEFYYFGLSNFVPGSGSGPHGVHGAGTIDGHMVKMSVVDNAQVGEVRVEPNPGDVRLTPDGKTLLATHFDLVKVQKGITSGTLSGPDVDSSLAIIDADKMERQALVDLCPASHGVVVTPDSALAITSCFDDEVAFVDLKGADHEVTHVPVLANPGTIAAPICEPYAVTLDGDTAWVSCFSYNGDFGQGPVIGVDIPSRSLNGKVLALPNSTTASFGEVRDGVMVFAHQNNDGVAFFDVTADPPVLISDVTFLDPTVCALPHVARFSEDGTKVFAVCEGAGHAEPGTFIVIDAAAHQVIGHVALGLYPDDIAIVRLPQ